MSCLFSAPRSSFFGRSRPAGFTFLEMLVVSVLMAGVTVMVGQFWVGFSRNMVDMAARTVTAQELRLVLSGLSQDFGPCVGTMHLDDGRLLLCKDAGPRPNGVADWGSPDVVVEYSLFGNQLRRFDQSAGSEITIADGVADLRIDELTDSVLQITISVRRAGVAREATLLWSKP